MTSCMLSNAVISPCGSYRYVLSRSWSFEPIVTWVMLNPSTADAMADDATIRKCVGFAKRWGFGGIRVVNLFAWRSRDPLALVDLPDPYGPEYGKHFDGAINTSSLVVAAWGCESTLKKKALLIQRATMTRTGLLGLTVPVVCLGMTKAGTPYHPLTLGYDTPRRSFKEMLQERGCL